jgi:hypothetical protein
MVFMTILRFWENYSKELLNFLYSHSDNIGDIVPGLGCHNRPILQSFGGYIHRWGKSETYFLILLIKLAEETDERIRIRCIN